MIKSIPGGVNHSHLPSTTETLFRYELWLNTCVLVRLPLIEYWRHLAQLVEHPTRHSGDPGTNPRSFCHPIMHVLVMSLVVCKY